MSRLTKDQYFLSMLELLAARSTCSRRRVGAVITDEAGRILATGYNGVPRNFVHCIDVPCPGAKDQSGDTRRCEAVHAELNAILQCWKLDIAKTIYVSVSPCFECAKAIANTSIGRVVLASRYVDRRGEDVLMTAGIHVYIRHADLNDADKIEMVTDEGLAWITRDAR